MQTATKQLNYRLYARKSSEAEDRQVLSLDSQVSELKKLAESKAIDIRDENIVSESHSAKVAFTRPLFEQLIKEIEQGKTQGLFAWHPNRLSRNAIDAARLIDLMDREKLIEIITPGQTFKNTPSDKFVFGLLCLQAKMENDSKGIDVKRGLRKKNEMGFPAGVANPGYINDYGIKGQRRIKADPERFELVKQLLELFLSGKYSVRKLLKYSDKVLGLQTIQRNKEGGNPLQLSALYRMLKNPIHAGFFYGKDENGMVVRYELNESVPRMITEKQYWQIQTMLGRKGAPCRSVNNDSFPYADRTRCGGCGGVVTAEHKYQLICPVCKYKFSYKNKEACPGCGIKIDRMENATYLHYIYYHCTKRTTPTCTERSVQEPIIDSYMANHVEEKLEISKSLNEWCIKNLDALAENDHKNEYERRSAWERELAQNEKQSEELVRMRMKGLITDDEFFKQKTALEADKQRIKEVLSDMKGTDMASLEEAKKNFNLIVGLAEIFRNGTFEEKQEALSALGSNLTLKARELTAVNKEVFSVIEKHLLEAKTENPAFEPTKTQADKDKTDVFTSVRPTLLRIVEDVRTIIQQQNDYIYIPDLREYANP